VSWLAVWTRAVVVPAGRRAGGAWAGAVVLAAVVFGPNGMRPGDVTRMAWRQPGFAAALCATWLLVFLPTARLLVRADAAAFLRSLPSPRVAPIVVGGAALVALQLPWLALWILGDGARGAAVTGATTLVVVGLARVRRAPPRPPWPAWSGPGAALRSIYLRGVRRRAGDALVRGVGLALLGGLGAGLFVHNNQLVDARAAALGASVIAIALVPAQVGPLLALVEAHRQSGWLATSLGLSRAARIGALAQVVAAIHVASTVLAAGAAALVVRDASTIAWLAGTALVVALGSSLAAARALIASETKATISTRTVVGAIAVAALAVLLLGVFGAPLGALALLPIGALALGRSLA
jgi:hypothetical protein